MLKQILRDMYIDPELLAELSEEQKQTLFCKMREEQVRRYNLREAEFDKDKKKKSASKSKKLGVNRVTYLHGSDGKEWVWVMGHHSNDKSIEEILEEEEKNSAKQKAHLEAEKERLREEEKLKKKQKEEEEIIIKKKTELEEEMERKKKEAELYATLKEARLEAERLEKERKEREKEAKELEEKYRQKKEREEKERKAKEEELKRIEVERAQQLYQSMKEAREQAEKLAEKESQKTESLWKEQLRRSKKADQARSKLARNARESIRLSKDWSNIVGDAGIKELQGGGKPPVPQKPKSMAGKVARPTRPENKQQVIEWYKTVEIPKGSGLDPQTNKPEIWFHGIISRQKAEEILSGKPFGSYLVRVSERVWGYTISCKDKERCKHFLVDTSGNTYQFFGANQIAHAKLADLINFHQLKPISIEGEEYLKYPCGQDSMPPDYQEFFK